MQVQFFVFLKCLSISIALLVHFLLCWKCFYLHFLYFEKVFKFLVFQFLYLQTCSSLEFLLDALDPQIMHFTTLYRMNGTLHRMHWTSIRCTGPLMKCTGPPTRCSGPSPGCTWNALDPLQDSLHPVQDALFPLHACGTWHM